MYVDDKNYYSGEAYISSLSIEDPVDDVVSISIEFTGTGALSFQKGEWGEETMKKGITITLDRPRTLRYGMNALAKIEDITGTTIMPLDLNNVRIRDLLAIVYAGLCHEDATLTLEQVGDLIDEYSDITTIAEKLGEAFTAAFGQPQNKGETAGE